MLYLIQTAFNWQFKLHTKQTTHSKTLHFINQYSKSDKSTRCLQYDFCFDLMLNVRVFPIFHPTSFSNLILPLVIQYLRLSVWPNVCFGYGATELRTMYSKLHTYLSLQWKDQVCRSSSFTTFFFLSLFFFSLCLIKTCL